MFSHTIYQASFVQSRSLQVLFKSEAQATADQLAVVESALPVLFALAQNCALYLVARVPNDDAQR